MSFSETIQVHINNIVEQYVDKLSNKFNLNKDELLQEWRNTSTVSTQKKVEVPVISNDLSKLTKPDLMAKCREKGLKVTGTKAELLERLTLNVHNPVPASKTSTKLSTILAKPSLPPVLQKLSVNIPNLIVKQKCFYLFIYKTINVQHK